MHNLCKYPSPRDRDHRQRPEAPTSSQHHSTRTTTSFSNFSPPPRSMALAPSSPRLPSPPPPAEIQIGPKSPSGGPPASLTTTELEQSLLDANSKRRIHPGTKAEDIAAGPPLVPLNEVRRPLCPHRLHIELTSASSTQPFNSKNTSPPYTTTSPPLAPSPSTATQPINSQSHQPVSIEPSGSTSSAASSSRNATP